MNLPYGLPGDGPLQRFERVERRGWLPGGFIDGLICQTIPPTRRTTSASQPRYCTTRKLSPAGTVRLCTFILPSASAPPAPTPR